MLMIKDPKLLNCQAINEQRNTKVQ